MPQALNDRRFITRWPLQKKGLVLLPAKARWKNLKQNTDPIITMVDRQKHKLNNIEENNALPFFRKRRNADRFTQHQLSPRNGRDENLIEKDINVGKILHTIMPSFRNIEPHLDENYALYYLPSARKEE